MRVINFAQFLLISALCVVQIVQICGDESGVVDMRYEILKLDEYILLVAKREVSQSKVVINCGFESGWCGFQNEKQDNFDWTLTSKSTPSTGTGPRHDISGKGSYIYIEASVPRRAGDTASFTSPIIPPMVYCLQFGFHAWGEDIGKLALYKKSLHDNRRDRIMFLSKNHGKKWHFVSVTVVHTSRFVIELEGVCGNGYRGDIALDNITLTEGKCPTIQRNNAEQCGVGFPGFRNTIPDYPAYHAWPWLVWLSPNSQYQSSCPGVHVSSDWLLTTQDCARKFQTNDITTYPVQVNKKKRRNVLKVEERSTNMQQPVILKLKNSMSTRLSDKVCLPSSIPLQNRVPNCYLLGLSTLGHEKSFVEFPATILSTIKCQRDIPSTSKINLDLTRQLCVQVNSSFSFNDSQSRYGYLVCKNTIINSWILQAMGTFFNSDFKKNTLVLRRVSFDVDWIENITNVSFVSPDVRNFTVPPPEKAPLTKGFQIMERTNKKCLTYESNKQKFTYTPCNSLNISQRFEWTQDHQLVTLHSNSCLESGGTPFHFLRPTRCISRRRSQVWICKGNTLMNVFYSSYIASKSDEHFGVVHSTQVLANFGHFVIFGTHDNLCSSRPTVKGVLQCHFNLHRTCGFDGVDSQAQFMWRISRTGSNEYRRFPLLRATDKFFRVIRRTNRGTPVAVLRSPTFRGEQCARFRVFFQGSSLNQLNVYKGGGGESKKRMFQRNATSDHYWRFHRVTIVPTACEAFQIVFEVVFSDFSQSKVAIYDIIISPGRCRSYTKRRDGECLKGWKLVNGQCMYFHDTRVTWHEASSICHIADAELLTHTAASELIPRGRPAWFGVRSCPTGRLYSAQGVPYNETRLFPTPVCLLAQKLRDNTTKYRTAQCDLKLPFACQKAFLDPMKTRNTCGWRNVSAENDRQWPWHVLIAVGNRCVCGGTLIAPGHVVTSTLCLSRVWMLAVKLFFPSSRKVIHKITRIVEHSMSGVKSGDNDVSIVIFEDDSSVHFACVMQLSPYWTHDDNNFLKDKRCVVLGWGTFKGSHRSCGSENYQTHEVEVVSRKKCSEYYGSYMVTDTMICAQAKNETTASCLGDTGGDICKIYSSTLGGSLAVQCACPLVCEIAGTWTLVGVTTWGIGCSATRKYGIFSDIGIMKPWIDIVQRENQY